MALLRAHFRQPSSLNTKRRHNSRQAGSAQSSTFLVGPCPVCGVCACTSWRTRALCLGCLTRSRFVLFATDGENRHAAAALPCNLSSAPQAISCIAQRVEGESEVAAAELWLLRRRAPRRHLYIASPAPCRVPPSFHSSALSLFLLGRARQHLGACPSTGAPPQAAWFRAASRVPEFTVKRVSRLRHTCPSFAFY